MSWSASCLQKPIALCLKLLNLLVQSAKTIDERGILHLQHFHVGLVDCSQSLLKRVLCRMAGQFERAPIVGRVGCSGGCIAHFRLLRSGMQSISKSTFAPWSCPVPRMQSWGACSALCGSNSQFAAHLRTFRYLFYHFEARDRPVRIRGTISPVYSRRRVGPRLGGAYPADRRRSNVGLGQSSRNQICFYRGDITK